MLGESNRGYIIMNHKRLYRQLKMVDLLGRDSRLYQLDLTPEQHLPAWLDGICVGSLQGLLHELQNGSIHSVLDLSHHRSGKVLATQTRRADLSGPALQAVHVEVGKYLADRAMDESPGMVLKQDFSHVQGGLFPGHESDSNLVILALMRGGEPMARGVYERFPRAQFVHYWDDTTSLLFERETLAAHIVIVDSVINKGNTIRKVLGQLEEEKGKIYVMTGVMHTTAAIELPKEYPRVSFIALRVSGNQYTGTGGTDTGNRLFGCL
jgi:uracil phosphoribosyltransferase